jgi:hypothetical protein
VAELDAANSTALSDPSTYFVCLTLLFRAFITASSHMLGADPVRRAEVRG